ncbi:hypothetical protein [Clostridium isatidis]|uniref:hypothetical protein n=1 Tax=Clostridium isatidis TaxID=182773 RepID=UPI003AB04F2D
MNEILKKEKSLYFKSKINYLKCKFLREHEYYIWKFVTYLRREETSKNILIKYFWRRKKNKLGSKLGFTIYANVFEEGLHIWHYGNIVVNGYAKVGKNCVLHGDNCIGNNGKDNGAPIIGDNVDIGVGAKIIGNVKIANNIKIGAGAVVISSFEEEGITIGGVPARRLK